MTVQETPGDRLTQAMKRASVKNQELADAAKVHVTTVSRWRNDVQTPEDAELDRVIALLKSKGVPVTAAWLRYGDNGTRFVREARTRSHYFGQISVDFESPTAEQKGKIWIEQFLLELIEEGADQDFLSWARRFLLSSENYVLYVGGTPGEMTDEQKLRHMQGLGVGVRAILKDRLKKGKSK